MKSTYKVKPQTSNLIFVENNILIQFKLNKYLNNNENDGTSAVSFGETMRV